MRSGLSRATALALLVGALIVAPAAVGAVDVVSEPAGEWLPSPSRQPVGDEDQLAGRGVGALRIPAIGVDEVVREGVDLSVIDQGPAHWAGTAFPGGAGNMVIAGHRATHSQPFADLDRLRPGDIVFVANSNDFEVMYRVAETFIVAPDALWISYDNGEPLLTMFACHPKGSAAQRIVVRAELVGGGIIA